jgi:hypothetical protein
MTSGRRGCFHKLVHRRVEFGMTRTKEDAGTSGRNLTPPPKRGAVPAWNGEYIRQVSKRGVSLPDESGVPVVVSRCAPRFKYI